VASVVAVSGLYRFAHAGFEGDYTALGLACYECNVVAIAKLPAPSKGCFAGVVEFIFLSGVAGQHDTESVDL